MGLREGPEHFPIGTVVQWTQAPNDTWLPCDGREIPWDADPVFYKYMEKYDDRLIDLGENSHFYWVKYKECEGV
jgi:hypothetical protein